MAISVSGKQYLQHPFVIRVDTFDLRRLSFENACSISVPLNIGAYLGGEAKVWKQTHGIQVGEPCRLSESLHDRIEEQSFRLVYFDAFAGTGDIQIGDEAPLLEPVDDYSPFIEGSAVRALECGTAFERYVFVEKSRTKSRQLRDKLIAKFPTPQDRIDIHQGEANEELLDFCASTDWKKTRAVVFLDPQGNQIKWKTIEAIARTKAIDLWYLFPAGLGVHRQIGRDGKVHFSHGASLDGLFGTTDWQHSFIEEQDGADLFQQRTNRSKVATPKSITLFMIRRMREVFMGGVLDEWLRLGSRGIHMYSLLFAWANPSEKAKLAGNLAKAVLGSARRGRSK